MADIVVKYDDHASDVHRGSWQSDRDRRLTPQQGQVMRKGQAIRNQGRVRHLRYQGSSGVSAVAKVSKVRASEVAGHRK